MAKKKSQTKVNDEIMTEDFLLWMEETGYVYTPDCDCEVVARMVEAIQSFRNNVLPADWVDAHQSFLTTKDNEYKEYVRLKEKFGDL